VPFLAVGGPTGAGVTLRAVRHAEASGCWRTSGAARGGALVVFGGLSLLAPVDNALNGHSWVQGLQVAALLLPLWFLFAWRPSVCLGADVLVVRNPLWTHHIPLSAVEDAAPGYFGMVIRRRDRRLPVTAWAVQQTNIMVALGAETRAQRAAERIRDAAGRPSGTREG
jgi:hypothetical protein